jgi:hypothetical protein
MSRPLRLLAVLALGVALATATAVAATAAQPTPPTAEDQHDRRLRNLRAEQADRIQTAMNLFRSGERNFVPDPDILGDVAAPPQVRPVPDRPVPAIPESGVGMIATVLLGLAGGVIGGCAVLASWTVATRRRPRQPASAT